MAFISCLLKSEVLQSTVDVKLYFPCDLPEYVGNKVKGVITLLHGYTGCGDDWLQMTAASRYAADNGLVLIAPSVGNCFYNDMAYGGAYFTFINEEMPLLLQKIFKYPPSAKTILSQAFPWADMARYCLLFQSPNNMRLPQAFRAQWIYRLCLSMAIKT
ncbi:MAG: hypothetical protein RR576_07085, partial [Oscillospiraceae bacterium]